MIPPTQDVHGQISSPAHDISRNALWWAIISAGIFSLWIRAGIPLVAAPPAVHDDQFFIRTARYLVEGQWLGPYDKMTLSKGMFYPLFMVLAFRASIPLKIAEHLIYLVASGFTASIVIRAIHRRWVGLTLFVALALNSVFWNYWLARVLREGLYASLSLSLFGLVALISYPELQKTTHKPIVGSILGIVWACFWLTREESVWLLPACVMLLGTGVANQLIQFNNARVDRLTFGQACALLRPIAVPLLVGTSVFLVVIGSVAGLNLHYYGVFQTNEFRSGSFLRAYGAFSRIKPNHFQRFVSVPLDARQRAYDVSPAARELSSSLEGDTGHAWASFGCSVRPLAGPCDLQAGWFMWALRDAVAEKGHYRSAQEASTFYARLADEIDTACELGKISCLPPRDTLMPPFQWEYLGEILSSARGLSLIVLTMGNGEMGSVPSVGSPQSLAIFSEITHERLSPAVGSGVDDYPLGRVDGWVAARSGSPNLRVIPHTQQAVTQSITILPAPDISIAHPGVKAVRYSLESNCPVLECDLAVSSDTEQVLVPFRALVEGIPLDTPTLMLFVDHLLENEGSPMRGVQYRALQLVAGDNLGGLQERIGFTIAQLYARSFLLLTVLALGGLVIAVATIPQQRPSTPALAIAFGSLVAVASRITLLAYIDAVSFPTQFVHYCAPASPFVIIFVVLGIYLGLALRPTRTDSNTE